MERMTKGEGMTPEEYIAMVEEENKKLSIIIENTKIEQKSDRKHIEELEEENKNLRDYVDNLDSENDNQAIEIEELKKENDKLKIHIEAKDKAYMDLLADYNYLKARIKKTERAFIKYKEKLEKLEVDLDMIVMNR